MKEMMDGVKETTGSASGKIDEKGEVSARNLVRGEGDYGSAGKTAQVVKEDWLPEIGMSDGIRKAVARSRETSGSTEEMSRASLRVGYGKDGNRLLDLAVTKSRSKNVEYYPMAQVKDGSDGSANGQLLQDTMISGGQMKGSVSQAGMPAADIRGDIGNSPLVLPEEGVSDSSFMVRDAAVDRISPEGLQNVVVGGEGCVAIDDSGDVRLRPHVLIHQIADTAAARLTSESGRIRIVLNPPQLGTVDMDVSIRNDKVCAVLHTDSSDVRNVLQSNMEQLRISLQNQGLTVDSISVFLHDKSDGPQYGFTGESSYREDAKGDEGQLSEDHEEAFPMKGHLGIDGSINVFV